MLTEGARAKLLRDQLSYFLVRKRDALGLTYIQFSKRTGLPVSTIYRLETKKQSITLDKLAQIMTRLKIKLTDIFPDS